MQYLIPFSQLQNIWLLISCHYLSMGPLQLQQGYFWHWLLWALGPLDECMKGLYLMMLSWAESLAMSITRWGQEELVLLWCTLKNSTGPQQNMLSLQRTPEYIVSAREKMPGFNKVTFTLRAILTLTSTLCNSFHSDRVTCPLGKHMWPHCCTISFHVASFSHLLSGPWCQLTYSLPASWKNALITITSMGSTGRAQESLGRRKT